MISDFYSSVMPEKLSLKRPNTKLINFDLAVTQIRELYKKSLEINLEVKQLRFSSTQRKSISTIDDSMLDDDQIEKKVKLAIAKLVDKHGRLNDQEL